MVKKCLVCGKEFVTYPSKVKIGRGKYCSRECCLSVTSLTGGEGVKTRFKKGQKCWKYKGWRYHTSRGGTKYIQVHIPNHPFSSKAGYVMKHRLNVEKELGRYLKKSEVVHHIDGDTLNNNINNLEVLDKREHDRRNVNLNIHKRWMKGR